ncbi:Type II secretion system (T2SS)-associated protein Gcp10 [Andalucia godoyi]|uniref:Type II secretion system (T2SS)-associated protein Gcp10 n=1 Tax=Andalucia godoyi TaxID=505711 RepID=A0A8K0AJW4_ANDGO|nr:Type II secretion system (T2SS)-associated protein Gcp10 [Andalucia godoyi]|eukprot:ANDGO_00094.mRNA.1 Type II secretion system (T2SS)-associated protein Gcp10
MVFSYVLSSSFLFMLTYRLLQILRPAQREPLRLTSASLLGAPQSGAANQTIRSVANHAKQTEAIAEFFGDRKLVDLRVLRSAMALSKEVQQAVHAETPSMGWRRYNRFFAAGTEELFTNVPSGRSPLVLKAPPEPSSSFPTMFPSIESIDYKMDRNARLQKPDLKGAERLAELFRRDANVEQVIFYGDADDQRPDLDFKRSDYAV